MTSVDSRPKLTDMDEKAVKYVPKGGWAEYQRKRRENHRLHGLCVYCTREADHGVLCDFHKGYHNEYSKGKRTGVMFKYVVYVNREQNEALLKGGDPANLIREAALLLAKQRDLHKVEAVSEPPADLLKVAKGLFK